MAKLADALDSGSSGATLGGSNPLERSEASERVPSAGGDPTTLLNRFAEELRRAPVAGGCAGANFSA